METSQFTYLIVPHFTLEPEIVPVLQLKGHRKALRSALRSEDTRDQPSLTEQISLFILNLFVIKCCSRRLIEHHNITTFHTKVNKQQSQLKSINAKI